MARSVLVAVLAALAVALGGAGSGVCVDGRTLNERLVLALGTAGHEPDHASQVAAPTCWLDVRPERRRCRLEPQGCGQRPACVEGC